MKRVLIASCALHVGAIVALAAIPHRDEPPAAVDLRDPVSVDFARPLPVAAALPTPAALAREPPALTAPARATRPSMRARVAVAAPTVRVSAVPPLVEPTEVTAPVHASLSAASLFASARTDVARFDVPPPAPPDPPPAPVDTGVAETARARQNSQGYVSELLANSNALEPPYVHAHYAALARRMRETWRPGFYRTPSMLDALLAAPRNMAHVAERFHERAEAFALTGRPDDPMRDMIPTDFEERRGFSTRTTSTIVEVEQNPDGTLRSIRVVRSAQNRQFDEAALTAVRVAFPEERAVPVPGGRRSRWEFDVVASRDPLVPFVGFMFNESNGFFEMDYPGALHVRTRIRPAGSRALDVPWPEPRPN